MNTLLVYPPKTTKYNNANEYSKLGFSIGLAYIAAFVNKTSQHNADIIIAPYQRKTKEDILQWITDKKIDLLGISVIQEDAHDAFALALFVKQNKPLIHITIGGQYPSQDYSNILTNCWFVDSVVCGEGEYPMVDLLDALSCQAPIDNISGLAYRDNDGEVQNNPYGRICNLDKLPFPIDEISKVDDLRTKIRIDVSAQRGCYGNCIFCSIVAFYKNTGIRRRSPKNVVDEIEVYYRNYNRNEFCFIDDDFIDTSIESSKWIEEFCKEVQKRGLTIKFDMVMRANDCDIDSLKQLVDIGLDGVGMGVESFSPSVLKRMNKNITLKDITESIRICRQLGLPLGLGFIMFEPDLTFAELRTNIRFLNQYGFFAPTHFYNNMKAYVGTPLRERLIKEKRLKLNEWYDVGFYDFQDNRVQFVWDNMDVFKPYLFDIEDRHSVLIDLLKSKLSSFCKATYTNRRLEYETIKIAIQHNNRMEVEKKNICTFILNELVRLAGDLQTASKDIKLLSLQHKVRYDEINKNLIVLKAIITSIREYSHE